MAEDQVLSILKLWWHRPFSGSKRLRELIKSSGVSYPSKAKPHLYSPIVTTSLHTFIKIRSCSHHLAQQWLQPQTVTRLQHFKAFTQKRVNRKSVNLSAVTTTIKTYWSTKKPILDKIRLMQITGVLLA